jgi:hypothetical protein
MKQWNYFITQSVLVDGDECVVDCRGSHLCGYTRIPREKTPDSWRGNYDADALQFLSVHGGLTYAEDDGDYCIFGFDCAHAGDENRPELKDAVHVLSLAKSMRQQLDLFAAKRDEWLLADRDLRVRIIEEIRAADTQKHELGLGAMISAWGGAKEFGE